MLRLWDSLFAAEPEASMESVDSAAVSTAAAGAFLRKGAPVPAAQPSSDDASAGSNKKLIVEFLNDCCCAILCMIRRQLLESDFSSALKLLQSAGAGIDVQRVLFKAQEIQKVRRAGGGYVKQAPAKPLPAPLTTKDLATPFTVPVLRPGELPEKKGHRTLSIPLLDAILPSQAQPSPAAAAAPSATPTKAARRQQQPVLHPPIISSAAAAASSSPSSSSSPSPPPPSSSPPAVDSEPSPSSSPVTLSSALHVAGDGVGALAAGVGALVMQGVDVVGHAVQSGAALAAVAAEAIAPPPPQSPPAKPAKLKPHKSTETMPQTDLTHAQPAVAH